MTNIVRLRGERLNLCTFRTDDEAVELYTKWDNDEDINIWMGRHTEVVSIQDNQRWVNSEQKPNQMRFNIVDKCDNKLIGTCGLSHSDITAFLHICIGEADYRGHGYGTEALELLVKFCFEQLNKHRVELGVNADNTRAINCYKKVGFTECARYHESEYYNGKYCDCLSMELLKKDYMHSKVPE